MQRSVLDLCDTGASVLMTPLDRHACFPLVPAGDAYLVGSSILAPDEDGFLGVDKAHNAAYGAAHIFALAVEMQFAALEVRDS